MAIETNISLNKTQKEYYQRFVNLSVNEEALPQGDGVIRISPFDDYFIFTIYDEIGNEDTPVDLSNVGSIFLSFIGSKDEIVIKNHTQVEEVDLSQGEVLFKITKSDSKKILALDNNNFYVSTQMLSETDDSVSDESILYQGIWLSFEDSTRISLTSQIEEQRLEYTIELAKLKDANTLLTEENSALVISAGGDTLSIQTLQASNEELTNEIAVLTSEISSSEQSALLNQAKLAQAEAAAQLRQKQLLAAIRNASKVARTSSSRKSFFRHAAANLENYSN
jgi:hypothetical protein